MKHLLALSTFALLAPLPSAGIVLDLPIVTSNGYSLVEVGIETPPKTFRLLFDTGSGSTWLVDHNCARNCSNGSGYERVGYDVRRSATGQLTGASAEINYIGGRTAGPVASDLFQVDSYSWRQHFLAANESNWRALPADGFLGLAFNTISVGNATTVVETLIPELDLPRFSIFYDDRTNGTAGSEGHLILGGSKESEYVDGDMVTIPIVPREEQDPYEVWRADFHSFSSSFSNKDRANESTVPFAPGRAVFDTGGATMIFPADKIEAIYESIGMNWTALINGDRVLQCTEFNSSWSVSFNFGKEDDGLQTVTLSGDQLARPGFPAAPGACWPPFEQGRLALLGKSFIRKFYSVWDFGAKEVSEYRPRLNLGRLKDSSSMR